MRARAAMLARARPLRLRPRPMCGRLHSRASCRRSRRLPDIRISIRSEEKQVEDETLARRLRRHSGHDRRGCLSVGHASDGNGNANICGATRDPGVRPDTDLCGYRPSVPEFRGVPPAADRCAQGRPRRGDGAQPGGFPDRVPRHHSGGRHPGERQPALYRARTGSPAERRRRRHDRRLQRQHGRRRGRAGRRAA